MASPGYGQTMIVAGADLWGSPGGGQSYHSFAETPIPAGFFGQGSEQFSGTILLEGLPLNDAHWQAPLGGADLGTTDTVVSGWATRRLTELGARPRSISRWLL
jgi:hypothetical protein